MTFIQRHLREYAVYWGVESISPMGTPTLAAAVELHCRWMNTQRKFVTPTEEERVSNAVVYVSDVVVIGGYLWKGRLSDAPASPLANKDVYQIKQFVDHRDFRMQETFRAVYL